MKGGSYKGLPSISALSEATDRYSFSMKLLLIRGLSDYTSPAQVY